MRTQIELSNQAATELAGSGDAVLRALEGHVACDLFLRGNVVTLDGDEEAVNAAAIVVRELADLIEQGHDIAPGTIAAVTGALDQHRSPAEILEDVVRHKIVQRIVQAYAEHSERAAPELRAAKPHRRA
jgi:phosphate starvation-inducible PhoH-like protein